MSLTWKAMLIVLHSLHHISIFCQVQ